VCLDFPPQARRARDCLGEAAASPVPRLDFSARKCAVRFFVSLEPARPRFLFNRAFSAALARLGRLLKERAGRPCLITTAAPRCSSLDSSLLPTSLSTATPCNASRRSRRTSVAAVCPVFPEANLGLVLRSRCRWFLSPVLHQRRRFFVGSSRFCFGFPPLAPGFISASSPINVSRSAPEGHVQSPLSSRFELRRDASPRCLRR
jgi:hypothetical protein